MLFKVLSVWKIWFNVIDNNFKHISVCLVAGILNKSFGMFIWIYCRNMNSICKIYSKCVCEMRILEWLGPENWSEWSFQLHSSILIFDLKTNFIHYLCWMSCCCTDISLNVCWWELGSSYYVQCLNVCQIDVDLVILVTYTHRMHYQSAISNAYTCTINMRITETDENDLLAWVRFVYMGCKSFVYYIRIQHMCAHLMCENLYTLIELSIYTLAIADRGLVCNVISLVCFTSMCRVKTLLISSLSNSQFKQIPYFHF